MDQLKGRKCIERMMVRLSKDFSMQKINEIWLVQKTMTTIEVSFRNTARQSDYKFTFELYHCTAKEFVYMLTQFDEGRFLSIVMPFCKVTFSPKRLELDPIETNHIMLKLCRMKDVIKTNIEI